MFLLPVIVSMLIAAVVVITTLFTAWAVVLAVGWWVFGRGHIHGPLLATGARCTRTVAGPRGVPGGPRPRPWI